MIRGVTAIALDDRLWFPDPRHAIKAPGMDGLVAVGGDLSVERLLLAYRSGIFPWSVNPITWWSPNPRGIIELDAFHVSKSLKKTVKSGRFEITIDQAFQAVMEGCAESRPRRRSTWISPEFIAAYSQLHRDGHAHSVECWEKGRLAGGIYGVSVHGLFAGESMFHRARDASKVALYYLVEHLRACGFLLMDIQMTSEHTRRLGATEISRAEYLDRLKSALEAPVRFEKKLKTASN